MCKLKRYIIIITSIVIIIIIIIIIIMIIIIINRIIIIIIIIPAVAIQAQAPQCRAPRPDNTRTSRSHVMIQIG